MASGCEVIVVGSGGRACGTVHLVLVVVVVEMMVWQGFDVSCVVMDVVDVVEEVEMVVEVEIEVAMWDVCELGIVVVEL